MPNYLIIYKPPRETFVDDATPAESAIIESHFTYLKKLQVKETLLMAGRIEDARFGLALIEAEDEEKANSIMQADPAVAGHLFSGELFPFRLALFGENKDK